MINKTLNRVARDEHTAGKASFLQMPTVVLGVPAQTSGAQPLSPLYKYTCTQDKIATEQSPG